MATPVSNRPVPDGYTEDWDNTLWNVGHVYKWSDVFEGWFKCGICTVRPGQLLCEAYEAWQGESMPNDYTIFFSKYGV